MKRRRGLAGPFAKRAPRPGPRRLVVEQCEDRLLMAVFTVTLNADSGPNTLRDAITRANASADPTNFINFQLTPAQPIVPLTPLPAITRNNLVINGDATASPGGAAKVEINGTNPNLASGSGLTVIASNVSIRNLVINSFKGNGITLNGSGNTLTGNYIGTDATGAVLRGNTANGIVVNSPGNFIGVAGSVDGPNVITGNVLTQISIAGPASRTTIENNLIGTNALGTAALGQATNRPNGIDVASTNNTIGGSFFGSGNLISGNNFGINVSGAGATNNLIQGNLIGTNLAGIAAIANTQYGIVINGATDNTIGGSRIFGEGNVISGNTLAGILVQAGSPGTIISGNNIGVTAAGAPLGNLAGGINLATTTGVKVGSPLYPGDDPDSGNIIAFNTGVGVLVNGGSSAGILSNSIYSNTGIGISLTNNGNNNILPPILTSAQTTASTTRITGNFAGTANTTFRLQFFSNKTVNPGGKDGQTYLGFLDVTPAFTGQTNFIYQFQGLVDLGDEITATVTQQPQILNNTSQFSLSQFVVQSQDPDLVVTTTTNPASARVGQDLTYQIQVTNSGRSAAFGVVLTDVIPNNVTFVSSDNNSTYSSATRTVTRNIGFLPVGQTVTVNIVVRPTASGVTLTNVARATTQSLESNTANNVSTTTLPVTDVADLAVFVTPLPSPVAVNSRLTYVVTLVNIGPSIAQNAVTTVQLPASMTDVQVTIDQGSFTGPDANNVITITSGTLPGVFSIPITISGKVNQVGPIDATASVTETTGEFDPNTANNTATARVAVANSADLAVTMVPSSLQPLLGENLLYTIVVTNNGPSTASAPILTDLVPAGLTYDPTLSTTSSGSLSFDGATVTGTLAPLASGASATITLVFRPSVAGSIVNTATVAHSQVVVNPNIPPDIDLDSANNTATATVLAGLSDIGVVIVGPADPLSINGQVVYTILVTNNGPAAAPDVALSYVLGVGASIVGATTPQGTAGFVGNTLSGNFGTIPAGQTIPVRITVNPTASGVLTAAAAVSTTGFDSNQDNNNASAINLVSPADLAVSVVGTTTRVLVGHQATYTITVVNGGPATATNVILSDVLPGNATLVGVTTSQGAVSGTGVLTAALGDLAPGASATLTITVIPTSVGSVVNTVAVASGNYDPNTSNNAATATVASFDQPGTFALVPGSASVNENAGTITFTVRRIEGTQGTVTVDFATSDLTGRAGLNYAAVAGTLTFPAGVTSMPLTIPILDDNIIGGNVDFLLSLSNPGGGALLSPQVAAVVTVVNTDRDFVAPKVVSVVPTGSRAGITGFVVTFDDAMDPARVLNLDNYRVSFSGRDPGSRAGSDVQLSGAVFDPIARTVTLSVVGTLPSNRFYDVKLVTTGSQPIADTSGNVLDGNSDGIAGGDYDTLLGQGNTLRYRDAKGNVVTLSLRRGGTMNVIRDDAGNASTVALDGIVARRSILSGSVKRPKNGGGRVTIGTISGLRRFGDVRSNLTTAPFFAKFAPVNVDGQIKSNTAGTTTTSSALRVASALAVKSSTVPKVSRTF